MKEYVIRTFCTVVAIAGTILAQSGPTTKSPAEVQALEAIQTESGHDARIAAVDRLLEKFPATEFKAWAISMGTVSLMEKIDYDHMLDYAENALKADPRNFQAMLILSYNVAKHTSEFDPDEQARLARIERYAKEAIEIIKDAPKPNPEVPELQWINARKEFTAQAEEALRLVAQTRKKLKDIVVLEDDPSPLEGQLQKAIDLAPDAATKSRALLYLAQLEAAQANWQEAQRYYRSVLAVPGVPTAIKQTAEKNLATIRAKPEPK